MIYAAVVLYYKGNNVSAHPFLVDAESYDEAIGQAVRIGDKLRPKGYDVATMVNSNTYAIEFDNVQLSKEIL